MSLDLEVFDWERKMKALRRLYSRNTAGGGQPTPPALPIQAENGDHIQAENGQDIYAG
jgi:hypothetical protein